LAALALAAAGSPLILSAPASAATISSSDIIVVDSGIDGDGQRDTPRGGVVDVDPRTGTQTVLSSGQLLRDPTGIAYGADGDLLVADQQAFSHHKAGQAQGGVIGIDPVSGVQTAVTSERHLKNPSGLAVEPDGDLVVVDPDLDDGAAGVLRVDPVSNEQTVVSEGGDFGNPEGIAVEPDGNILVIDPDALNGAGALIRVNPTTGAQTVLSKGGNFGNPSGVAVEASGSILVVDPDLRNGAGGVVRIPKAGGSQQVVASGGNFGNPTGIAVDTDGSILVADPDAFSGESGGIFRLDPGTGDRTVVASGGKFRDPVGVILARPTPVAAEAVAPPGYQAAVFTQQMDQPVCYTQTYTVPAGTTRLGFQAIGEAGEDGEDATASSSGHDWGGTGGFGAMVTGTLKVTPGEKLYVNAGTSLTGGQGIEGSGRGGQMSFISTAAGDPYVKVVPIGTSSNPNLTGVSSLTVPSGGCVSTGFLVVAGGGGGGGAAYGGATDGGRGGGVGGDAGPTGTNGRSGQCASSGVCAPGRGGGGATTGSGGAGGPTSCTICSSGHSGDLEIGGSARANPMVNDLVEFLETNPISLASGTVRNTTKVILQWLARQGRADGGGGGGGGGYYGGGAGGNGNLGGGGGGGGGSSYVDTQGQQTLTPDGLTGGDKVISSVVSTARTRDTPPSVTLTPLNDAAGTFGSGLTGDYYDNADLSGHTMTRVDPQVDFNWNYGAPDRAMGTDTFSASWSGLVKAPETGTYTFSTRSDDGARLWIDNKLVIDKWQVQSAKEWSATVKLQAGVDYPIRLEYYDNTAGATAQLLWQTPSESKEEVIPAYRLFPDAAEPGSGLTGAYFDDAYPGQPQPPTGFKLTRVDRTVDFDWGNGSPDSSIGPDTFTVLWNGFVQAPETGTYTFTTNSDDGVMLEVNGQRLITKWQVQSAREWSAKIDLQAGQKYHIDLSYFENTAGAKVQLLWQTPSETQEEVIPAYRLSTTE
jgi:hypothetical protein